jgi:hypothetical protein
MRTRLSTQVFALAAVVPYLAWSPPARACDVDTDCSGTTCGGEVCQWSNNDQTMTCVAAGTNAQGNDGWCTATTDCKCAGEGATCNTLSFHCTFTLPPDGGATSLADAAVAEASTSATPESDAESTAVPESDATAPADAGGTAPSSGGGKSSGCSIAGVGTSPQSPVTPLAALGLAVASVVARKRRP